MTAPSPSGSTEPRTSGRPDWLGYQCYADALWSRIQRNFALDSVARVMESRAGGGFDSGLPTGDPLVVGIYGEWGVGKSRLLELMYQLAAKQSAKECAQRALDPAAWTSGEVLRLTVPVWFHPWKYEHESHLSVPLLMHLADAVQETLHDSRNLRERTQQALVEIGKTTVEAQEIVRQGTRWFNKAVKVAHGIASNGLVKATVGLAAGTVGLGAAASKTLELVERTAAMFAPSSEERGVDDPSAPEKGDSAPVANTPEVTVDGRYYYNVHRYLRELTHITPERASKALKVRMAHEIHLNFVVFVDDLDRCLPEKAVEMLEVVKTVLNVESFAFVVALDDEVIERGISYRYKEYRLQNAKPDMPITGFEYLEKIVHLPFRLPPLTRVQAQDFLLRQEERLFASTAGAAPALDMPAFPRLWFTQDPPNEGVATSLVHLLLDSFDAYVPRKLGRAMELMFQFQQVFARNGVPIQAPASAFSPTSSGADARMVLFCVLLQLFAPEIFRLLRRRPELFGHWMRAYLNQDNQPTPVFSWQKSSADQLMTLEVSDADMYRWVALGSRAALKEDPGAAGASPSNQPPSGPAREHWGDYLGKAGLSASDRYSVEQVRLPLATALSGFREMQRHAFAPVRLGGAMAFAMGWTDSGLPRLQDYLNLYNDQRPAVGASVPQAQGQVEGVAQVAVARATAIPPVDVAPVPASAAPAQVMAPTRAFRSVDVLQMMELLRSPDASTRAALLDRLNLHSGELIDPASVKELAVQLGNETALDGQRVAEALAALAPYLSKESVREAGTWPVFASPDLVQSGSQPDFAIGLTRPYAALAARGLAAPLGLTDLLSSLAESMQSILELSPILPIGTLCDAADLLGALGDPRFDFDPEPPNLPRRRAMVRIAPDDPRFPAAAPNQQLVPLVESNSIDEPLLGFVRVRGTDYEMRVPGLADVVRLDADYFIGRTPVTVQQFGSFVESGGYEDDAVWDRLGIEWRNGELDSRIGSMNGNWISRPKAMRRAPWRWREQTLAPTRPVVGINWFEARAYAEWLRMQLASRLSATGLASYAVRLPTEPEWQRAALAVDMDRSLMRRWPWSPDVELDSKRAANVLDLVRVGHTSPVGLFEANPIGLYDLAGNVWEWMDNGYLALGDDSFDRFAQASTLEQFISPELGPDIKRIAVRGGSWQQPADRAQVESRESRLPWDHDDTLGLRVGLVSLESKLVRVGSESPAARPEPKPAA